MEKEIGNSLNKLLIEMLDKILAAESRAVITEEFKDITNNDMHIIEAVGIDAPRRMSDIAKRLHVTTSTLTINMNSLEKKGYLMRSRSDEDKRVVRVILTDKGRKAFFHHRDYHWNMIRAINKGLEKEEKEVLVRCLEKLNVFLDGEV